MLSSKAGIIRESVGSACIQLQFLFIFFFFEDIMCTKRHISRHPGT